MHCVLVKCDHMEDWWTVDRAEHDGREWMEETGPNSAGWMCSSRPSDADIEGPSAQMLALAKAIEAGESESFKRCAAVRDGETYKLYSPRNSREPAILTMEEAKALARDMLSKLG